MFCGELRLHCDGDGLYHVRLHAAGNRDYKQRRRNVCHQYLRSGRKSRGHDRRDGACHAVRLRRSCRRCIATINPDGSIVRTQYDGGGRIVATTDADGNVTQYKYDRLGRKIEEIDPTPGGPGNLTSPVILYGYDSRGNLQYVTNTYLQGSGTAASLGDPSCTTTYYYDSLGRKTAEVQPDPDDIDGTNGPLPAPITLYGYDANGNLTSVVDARGASDDTLDAVGYATDVNGDDAAHTTTYRYDESGHKIEDILPDPSGNTANPVHSYVWYYYDGNGNLLYEVNSNGATASRPATFPTSASYNADTTQYVYDALGHKIEEIDPAPNSSDLSVRPVTQYNYDCLGNLISVVDPLNNATYYQYNERGQAVATTDALGNTTSTLYDAVGNAILVTNALGQTTTTQYDAMNRTVIVQGPKLDDNPYVSAPKTTYQYDHAGNLLSTTDPRGDTTWYQYDALNRKVGVTDALGSYSGDSLHTTTTMYDEWGRVSQVTDQLGRVTYYEYDNLGRQTGSGQADSTGTLAASGLVAYWKLDGNLADTVSGNTGNFSGSGQQWVPAQFGEGLKLDGNEVATVTYGPLDTTAHDCAKTTVSFWMNWDGVENEMPFCWGGGLYDLWIVNSYIGFNTGWNDILGTTFSKDQWEGQWVHIAAVFCNDAPSSGTVQLYINGQLQTLIYESGTCSRPDAAVSSTAYIGGCLNGYQFSGVIDDVRIYDRQLSAAEVLNVMHSALWSTTTYDADGNVAATTDPLGNATYHEYDNLGRQTGSGQSDPTGSMGGSGLVRDWKLDGSLADDSGCNDGTFTGSGQQWVAGHSDGGLKLNGSGAVTVTNLPLDTTANDYAKTTVSFWMKWDGVGNEMPFCWNGGLYDLWIVNDYIGFNTGNGECLGTQFSAEQRAGQWVHVAAVFCNGTPTSNAVELYIDGQLQSLTLYKPSGSTPWTNNPLNAAVSNTAYIGSGSTGYMFSGTIDDVRIYSRQLTGDEVLSVMNSADPLIVPSGLVRDWKLDGNLADASGYNDAAFTDSGLLWADGHFGEGLKLNGSGAVDVTNLPLDTTANDGAKTTVSFWMKWDGSASENGDNSEMPFCWDGANLYDLWMVNGYIGFNTGGGECLGTTFSKDQWENQWVHIAAVFCNGAPSCNTVQLYINGQLQPLTYELNGQGRSDAVVSSTAYIGECPTGKRFGGVIDDVRIYNRELSAAEVLNVMHSALWSTTTYDAVGNVTETTDPSGNTTYYDYDNLGRQVGSGQSDPTGAMGASGLVGYWKLDGSPADATSGHNDGIFMDSGLLWADGHFGEGLSFDGGGAVAVTNVPVNTTAGDTVKTTVTFWMKWDGSASENGAVGEMPFCWDGGPYDLWIVNGYIGFNTGCNDILGTTFSADQWKDQWVHIAAVFCNGTPSSSTVQLYINGELQTLIDESSGTNSRTDAVVSSTAYIGEGTAAAIGLVA